MNMFTIAGPTGQKQAAAQGEAAPVTPGDPFARLLACLPSIAAGGPAPAVAAATDAPSALQEAPPPEIAVLSRAATAGAGKAIRLLAHLTGKDTAKGAGQSPGIGLEQRDEKKPLGQEAEGPEADGAAVLAVLALAGAIAPGPAMAAKPAAVEAGAAPAATPAAPGPAPVASLPARPSPGAPIPANPAALGVPALPAALRELPAGPLLEEAAAALLPAGRGSTEPSDGAAPASPLDGSPADQASPAGLLPPPPLLPAVPTVIVSADAVPLSSPDQAAARQLDLARDSQWLDRLATDIARTAGSDGSLRFNLHPQSLGSLTVEVRHAAEGVAIRLTAETDGARSILADAQPRLAAEARAHGVRIAETHVDLAGHFSGGGQRAHDHASPEPQLRTAAAGEELTGRPDEAAGSASTERYA